MKPSLLVTWLGAFLFALAPSRAQEASLEEKISDVSPDKKFAVRISFESFTYLEPKKAPPTRINIASLEWDR